jgi:hypothetical protein
VQFTISKIIANKTIKIWTIAKDEAEYKKMKRLLGWGKAKLF